MALTAQADWDESGRLVALRVEHSGCARHEPVVRARCVACQSGELAARVTPMATKLGMAVGMAAGAFVATMQRDLVGLSASEMREGGPLPIREILQSVVDRLPRWLRGGVEVVVSGGRADRTPPEMRPN